MKPPVREGEEHAEGEGGTRDARPPDAARAHDARERESESEKARMRAPGRARPRLLYWNAPRNYRAEREREREIDYACE